MDRKEMPGEKSPSVVVFPLSNECLKGVGFLIPEKKK